GWLAGLVVLFSGVREAFGAAPHLLPQIQARAPSLKGAERKPHRGAVALVAGIAAVLLAVTTWVVLRSGTSASAPQEIVACNGSAALCDRTLDQVIFATSHNSMGGADNAGWMFPNQNASIERQLEDGVRGFLIDAHYGVPVGDKVQTELEDEKAAMAKCDAALG